MTQLVRGTIRVDGREESVVLTRVGLAEDDPIAGTEPRPWRVEAPGARFDQWLVADDDVLERE